MTMKQQFLEAYEKNLLKAIAAFPGDYAYGPEKVPLFMGKLGNSIDSGEFEIGRAMKWTCRELKIKPTRKAICEFCAKVFTPE